MSWFDVLFPAGMIVTPALFMGLWCYWTGVGGMRPILLATLVALLAFGASSYLLGPELAGTQLHRMLWGMGGLFALLWGFGVPMIRRAVGGLPELPRGAVLKPRHVELFRGAFVWPFAAWAVLAGGIFVAGPRTPFVWVFPACGLLTLFVLRWSIGLKVAEPEPLGGPDPEELARQYAAFRRRRVLTMYWMFVVLGLLVTSGWLAFPTGAHAAWIGSIGGCAIGVWGAVFGTWADAQRYLLRRQLSGAAPPPS